MTNDEILNEMIAICQKKEAATLTGDYRTNNKEGKKAIKYFKLFEKDSALAAAILPKLMNSDNVVAKTDAAAWCLSLGIDEELAQSTLKEILKSQDNIFGFNAEMVLKEYERKGYLLMYQGQQLCK